MRNPRAAWLSMIALLVLCFGLEARLNVWFQTWQGNRTGSADVLNVLLGDARQMFSNHFYVKADAYYHSGFYPTIFDNKQAFQTAHIAEDSGAAAEGRNTGDETSFMGKPLNWIDAFERNFIPNRHTHVDEGGATGKADDLGESSEVGEILPWLQLSATLDPNNIRSYTVAAYWLRERMNKPDEAEKFLREGLQANPGSYEILYELGRVYNENHHDPVRARNLWEAALKGWHQRWPKQEDGMKDPDASFSYIQITSKLAEVNQKLGDYPDTLKYMELWKSASPNSNDVQKLIDEFLQSHQIVTNVPPAAQVHQPGAGH
jgi:tetratricopeptide (TPR) repeat protein